MQFEYSRGGVYDLALMRRTQYLHMRTADNHREAIANPSNCDGRELIARATRFYNELLNRLYEEKTELDLVCNVFRERESPYGEAYRYKKSLRERGQCTFFAALDAAEVVQWLKQRYPFADC